MTPLFYLCFVLAMPTQKMYFKGKKNLDSRSCVFFLDMSDANFWAVNKTRIGLLGSDRTGNSPYKFKVTLKVIACWLLYDCEGLG